MTLGIAPPEWRTRQSALFQTLDDPKAVMVFGYGSVLGAGTRSHGAMRYLTGWDSHEAMSLYVYSETQRVLLLSSPFVENLAFEHFSETQIIPVPVADWGEVIAQAVSQTGPIATIGFSEMPQAIYRGITSCISEDRFVDGEAFLAKQRLSKSAQEIAVLERGAAICDDLFEALPGFLSPERPAYQTQLDLEHRALAAGADYCKTWLTIDRYADGPRYWPNEANHFPKAGDQVLFGIALTVQGYWAHGIRMGTVGPPTPEHHKLWSVAYDALRCGEETLRQNTSLSQPAAAMSEVIDAKLQSDGWQGSRRFRNGHGLGTSYEEPWSTLPFTQDWHPNFASKGPIPEIDIPHGSVFELHPNLFVPSVGGAVLGDMFVVEAKCARPLLQFSRSLMELHIS